MNATAFVRNEPIADVQLRRGRQADAAPCGQIVYDAFATISAAHNFPRDFPDAATATALIEALLRHPRTYSVVAEREGRVIGSNFLHKQCAIAGVGPITVVPEQQNASVGRRLMEDVLARAEATGAAGVRLVQAAYHGRSLSLYTKLGFVVREPLALMQGPPLGDVPDGYGVRTLELADLPACDALCLRVHGHNRHSEVEDAVTLGSGRVVERDGRVTGYTTSVAFMGHSVAETNDDLQALIGASPSFDGPGFLLPMRNAAVFRWCLAKGLRVVAPMTLMSKGLYNEPAGAFLPSVIF